MEQYEKYLDPQLWHACAGNLVHMPTVNSEVFYFPQGHAEHSSSTFDFRNFPRIQSHVPCRVSELKFMADPETDEVFAKIRLLPHTQHHGVDVDDDDITNNGTTNVADDLVKPTSFAKTLTQSDTNNGGGFSVPKHCAETIFPRLDGSTNPPSQTILAKDVHGETWKFRHIYRGTPKRHLLTTGWTAFVNRKKLVVGDSIVFFRLQNGGDLCIGIRRAKKRGGNEGRLGIDERFADMGRVKPEHIMEAASLASNGQPFTAVYYPRAGAPEFCIEASRVSDALKLRYRSGMRFKMDFEEEKSLCVRSFVGTVSSVNAADFIHWPDSPWRVLEVNWDEHGVLKDVKRVSPWMVELVSDTSSTIQIPQFSSPHKKLKPQQHSSFLDEHSIPLPNFSGDHHKLDSPSEIFSGKIDSPVSMQGARHNAQYASSSSSDDHFNNKRLHSFLMGSFPNIMLPGGSSSSFIIPKPDINESVSSSDRLTLENSNSNQQWSRRSDGSDKDEYSFKLFGKTIIVEKQDSPSCNEITSEEDVEKTVDNTSDDKGTHSI